MTENTARQIANMKSQTIGVEVEMYGIARRRAAKVAAGFFGTGRFEDTASRNSYYAWSAWDNKGREWKFQRDVSISARNFDEQTELVTPILNYEDIELLQGLLRELRHNGARSNPAHMCGIHCHIGLGDHTPQTLRNLANLILSRDANCLMSLGGTGLFEPINRQRAKDGEKPLKKDFERWWKSYGR